MEPSTPVCSDGVVIDVTPPTIGEIFLQNLFVKPGLAKDNNDVVYYLDKNAVRHNVSVGNGTDCRQDISQFKL